MMNELLNTMASDMGINRFLGETDESFVYRICYSALGQWCLHTAQSSSDGVTGATKHSQTIMLNELLFRYSELFQAIAERFVDDKTSVPVHFRRVYEETGYLITGNDNRNQLANFGRSISIGDTALFFGLPNTIYSVNGLGVFTSPTDFQIPVKELLIRDDLNFEDYFWSQFDIIDFYERDINTDELEFFNPLSNSVPSQSWARRLETDCSLARKSETGPFYRVMRTADDHILFADELIEQQNDNITSYEFRRLYFALKAHYKKPLKASIIKLDKDYSKIRVGGHLPNREYYFLLLLSWPLNNAFDKANFLIKNKFLQEVTEIFINIGVDVNGG